MVARARLVEAGSSGQLERHGSGSTIEWAQKESSRVTDEMAGIQLCRLWSPALADNVNLRVVAGEGGNPLDTFGGGA